MNRSQQACVVFDKVIVNSIENSSGIFIGTNQAIGWSAYGKTNQGFGSVSDARLSHAVSVIHDSDIIDASVQDTRNFQISDSTSAFQQCAVEFRSVNANALNNGSALDIGDNKQPGWRSSRKNNYGNGKYVGANAVAMAASLTIDNDVVDAPFQTGGQIVDTSAAVKNIRISQNPPE